LTEAWYLFDAQVDGAEEVSHALLCLETQTPRHPQEPVLLPVLPTGRIHEVVSFCSGSPPIKPSLLSVANVSPTPFLGAPLANGEPGFRLLYTHSY
jgi:hypothetical protein